MKNKFLIGTITFFAAIFTSIFILNVSTSSTNKNNYFDRKFSKNAILKFEKKNNKLNKNSKFDICYSNTAIVEGELKKIDSSKLSYTFSISDDCFSTIINRDIKLPINSNIILVDKNCIIYYHKGKLYKLDFKSNNITEIQLKNLDISFIISLENDKNKYLFFGEVFENNVYKSGFFILDVLNNKIIDSKVLQYNSKYFRPEVISMHSGYFQRAWRNSMVYTCDKSSKIFLFNGNGLFVKEVNTKDNTQLPKVIKKGNCIYYSRNGLRFSNNKLFMDNDYIYVFSMASEYTDKIIIDQYTKATMKYIQSYKLDYNKHPSEDIQNVFIEKNKIILKFESNYASFTFSKYI